VIVVPNAAKN